MAGLVLFGIIDKEFMPAADQGRYLIRLETPIDYSLRGPTPLCGRLTNSSESARRSREPLRVTGSDYAPDSNKSKLYVNLKERKDRDLIQLDSMSRCATICPLQRRSNLP